LDSYFVHRTRAIEGKDDNPLNEVRMLSTSTLRNKAELMADKAIEYKVGPQARHWRERIGASSSSGHHCTR
jgi:hypothetical protein